MPDSQYQYSSQAQAADQDEVEYEAQRGVRGDATTIQAQPIHSNQGRAASASTQKFQRPAAPSQKVIPFEAGTAQRTRPQIQAQVDAGAMRADTSHEEWTSEHLSTPIDSRTQTARTRDTRAAR